MTEPDRAACRSARLQLADDRQLGYLCCGADTGRPFFYFHGVPGSRHEATLIDRTAKALDIRVMSVDRPGYGLSDYRPDRRLTDWPQDILALADALGLDQFGAIGVSGGGPYALACAHEIAERLTSIGIVCGLGPVYKAELLQGMKASSRLAFYLADAYPWLFKCLYGQPLKRLAAAHPESLVRLLAYYNGGADRPLLLRPDILNTIAQSLPHAFQRGIAASMQDLRLYQQPWGFELSDIRKQILLWHGTGDSVVPCRHSEYMHARLQHSKLTLVPKEGHFSLPVLHAENILKALCETPV